MLFWGFTWVLFSKVIWKIKNNEALEITLTMVLAHLTFILAEWITHYFHHILHIKYFWISGVISTVIAWIIIWNYGKYKISPKVEHHMETFWEFFAFVSNSIVFILMWLILADINIDFSNFIIPILLVIFVVSIARAISVYIPIWIINSLKVEEKVSRKRQHLLSWGSLRWALALMMALMIPWKGQENYYKVLDFQQRVNWVPDYDIKDFILVITIWSIMFTLFIKATTISYMMNKMWVTKLTALEEFEYDEAKILANIKILKQLNKLYERTYLTFDEYSDLKNKYEKKLQDAIEWLKELLKEEGKNSEELIRRALSLYALWVEKKYLKELFEYNEISEDNFTFILRKISRQVERLESWAHQFSRIVDDKHDNFDIFEKIRNYFRPKQADHINKYIRNRTRVIITRKVIKELTLLKEIDFWFDDKIIENIIKTYKEFHKSSKEKMDEIWKKYRSTIMIIESNLTNKTLLKIEEEVIEWLHKKEIITPKLYIKFKEEIEKWIGEDIKKVY
jgi:CPA1 family monovalent cation:H+ antiporter